jgi:thioredoxin 1
MSVTNTTDERFAADVLASPIPVLVEFTADWCPPCRMVAPVLEQIAAEEAGRLHVTSLDVDTNPQTTLHYQVLGMPTFALFVKGEVVARFTGARSRSGIMSALEPHLEARAAAASR